MRSVRRAKANGNAGFAGFAQFVAKGKLGKGSLVFFFAAPLTLSLPSSRVADVSLSPCPRFSDLVPWALSSLQSPDATPRTKSGPARRGCRESVANPPALLAMTHETGWWGLSRRSPVRENWLAAKGIEGGGLVCGTGTHNAMPQCHSRAWPLRQEREERDLVMLASPMSGCGRLGHWGTWRC
ncbi:hypothetical protein ASPBRDRAFT_645973 [Aspergillus brasiliensis CBS 101740]|uniref:Uncharacterized protein n=1 Tax=Aspergillus brasiliensis (strain CBS 101740 / IMI 381727 / IBT 21946) TaxID=767769 RepID=A0A1L9UE74_ASPBC|nr:hypothetical protein ASPBRDRAFT_645973 [Aspergillus brasiliensis CBS 101740]